MFSECDYVFSPFHGSSMSGRALVYGHGGSHGLMKTGSLLVESPRSVG